MENYNSAPSYDSTDQWGNYNPNAGYTGYDTTQATSYENTQTAEMPANATYNQVGQTAIDTLNNDYADPMLDDIEPMTTTTETTDGMDELARQLEGLENADNVQYYATQNMNPEGTMNDTTNVNPAEPMPAATVDTAPPSVAPAASLENPVAAAPAPNEAIVATETATVAAPAEVAAATVTEEVVPAANTENATATANPETIAPTPATVTTAETAPAPENPATAAPAETVTETTAESATAPAEAATQTAETAKPIANTSEIAPAAPEATVSPEKRQQEIADTAKLMLEAAESVENAITSEAAVFANTELSVYQDLYAELSQAENLRTIESVLENLKQNYLRLAKFYQKNGRHASSESYYAQANKAERLKDGFASPESAA